MSWRRLTDKCHQGGCQQDGATLSSVVPSIKMRSNGQKLKHTKFYLNRRKNFMWRMAEHWDRLPREVIETFQIYLDSFLLQLTLPWRVGLDDLQWFLPNQINLCLHDVRKLWEHTLPSVLQQRQESTEGLPLHSFLLQRDSPNSQVKTRNYRNSSCIPLAVPRTRVSRRGH